MRFVYFSSPNSLRRDVQYFTKRRAASYSQESRLQEISE
jgi:hypothetical protein